jgi:hypothetical protein
MLSTSRPASFSVFDDGSGFETDPSLAEWLTLIRAEYLEMPGLNLTARQAQRLWNLDSMTCQGLLQALVDNGFLRRTLAGVYARADLAT